MERKKQLFYGFAFLHSFIATANKRVLELLGEKNGTAVSRKR